MENQEGTGNFAKHGDRNKMPEIDFAGLNKFLQEQGQNAWAQPQQPAQQAQQPQSKDPDTGAEQDGYANIKDGDTFTDENGQQWQYTVMNFNVVPEDTKDEIVDDLSGTGDEPEGGREAQDNEESDESESVDYDGNLERGLDIALSILREEDESDAGVAKDSALDILMNACDEVLGTPTQDTWTSTTHKELDGQRPPTEQVGGYNKGQNLTFKQNKYTVGSLSEIPQSLRNKGKYKQLGKNLYEVQSYLPDSQKKAKEKSHKSNRFGVAAKFEDCKAKDPYKCRYHGASFMRNNFGKILESHGLPATNFEVMIDPEKKYIGGNEPIPYRLVFATPIDTPDDMRRTCAREFFMKHPELVYELPKNEKVGDLQFSVKSSNDFEDLPDDAPSWEDYQERFETKTEAQYGEGNNAKGAESYTEFEKLSSGQWFDILSEFPRNIVELNEDMVRYLNNFPDCVPEGMSMEDIQDLYSRFKKANATKKGTQAYILNGEVTDRAEALAEAAELGFEKEAQEYYNVSQEVYDIASLVLNNVQKQLQDAYEEVYEAIKAMPGEKVGDGSSSKFKSTYYFGNAYKVKAHKFPLNIDGKEEVLDLLKDCIKDYCAVERQAMMLPDKIMKGCKYREPLLVKQGIAVASMHLKQLQLSAETLGELQDTIIENMSEQRRKKNGISLPSEKGKKSNAEASTHVAPAKEHPQKAEKPVAKVKEDTKVETLPEGTAAPANGTAPQLSAKALEQIKAAAMKDKNIRALDKARTKMFQTFGADSEQYKTADKKAIAALNAFFQKKVAEITANAPANPAEPTAEESVKQQEKEKSQKDKKVDAAQPQNPVAKTEKPKKEEPQQQTQKPEPVTHEPAPVQKPIIPRSKKPQSSVVKMAKGEQQTANAVPAAKNNEQAVETSGAGLDIVRGMKISDKPTLEEAKDMNEQFAALEKRLRGLTQVYTSKTSDSKDWRAAEAELKAIKSEIDGLMQNARGKGYLWTKDSPRFGIEGSSDRRPLDIPTNFHLSGIKDESGNTVRVPYNPPKAGEMDIPASTDTLSEEGGESTKKDAKKQRKTFKKKADYWEDFNAIDEKVGVIGQGPYKEKSITDLIRDGYEVKPITTNGQLEYYFGLPDDNSTYGIRISKEQPPIRLSNLFEKRMGGNLEDEQAFHDFVEALRWKVKDYKYLF